VLVRAAAQRNQLYATESDKHMLKEQAMSNLLEDLSAATAALAESVGRSVVRV